MEYVDAGGFVRNCDNAGKPTPPPAFPKRWPGRCLRGCDAEQPRYPLPQIFAQRVSDRDFDALNAAGDEGPAGIGSDGTAMLVVDETPIG